MTICFPSIDALRQALQIQELNTGRRIELTGPAGLITDDIEGLHAISDEKGRIFLHSGIEFPMHFYRGQTRNYESCVPTLARLNGPQEQLLALCRRVAFEDVLGEHPMVQLAERTSILGGRLHVDREGLAQHYGQATDMLDITSHFDVAAFFATCKWNEEYAPEFAEQGRGVIYRISSVFSDMTPEGDLLRIVGWQPLPRPEQQRASAVQLRCEQDFCRFPSVETFEFEHDADLSRAIWEKFDGGKVLFPDDVTEDLSRATKKLTAFTDRQIDRAWQRLSYWTGETIDPDSRTTLEASWGIQRIACPSLSWDGLLAADYPEQCQMQMERMIGTVRYRRVCYL